jgi:hypothetical protein
MLIVVAAVIGYLALIPNDRGELLSFLPGKIRRWLCEHDDFNNIVAFGVLGSIVFRIRSRGARSPRRGTFRVFERVLSSSEARLVLLMALVFLLELVQLVIPGRICDLQDVCSGWSGLFAAWLAFRVRSG